MAWCYPLTFDPQGAFLCLCSVSFVPKVGNGDPLIFYSNRVLLLFFLAMTITFRCSQETNTDYLPCFCCVVNSILEGKQKADCKCLNWSPSNSYLRKCKQEASCKCLTLSPSLSCSSSSNHFKAQRKHHPLSATLLPQQPRDQVTLLGSGEELMPAGFT